MVYNAPTHAMQILKPAMKKITTIYPANPQYKKMILKHPESKLLFIFITYSNTIPPSSFRFILTSSSDPWSDTIKFRFWWKLFEIVLGRERVTCKDKDVLLTVTYSSSAITARPTIYTSIWACAIWSTLCAIFTIPTSKFKGLIICILHFIEF